MQLQVNVPDIATIIVTGPVGCGKSALLGEVEKVLKEKFGATVILSQPLRREAMLRGGDLGAPIKDWEADTVRKTMWVLHEA